MINIIFCKSKNNVIGKDGQLPWSLPSDMKHFRKLTTGHICIMGRKTYESIPDQFKPLPNRLNIIVSKTLNESPHHEVELYSSITDALMAHIHSDKEVFFIGGESIYNAALDFCDTIYMTNIEKDFEGDTFSPDIDYTQWLCVDASPHEENNDLKFSFMTFKRRKLKE